MQPRNQGLCGSLRLLSSLARRRPHDAVESRFSNAVHVRASTVTWCVYAFFKSLMEKLCDFVFFTTMFF